MNKIQNGGFTLIETLVAISLLTIAIVAPMTLTMQSLSSAFYARDQITASYLAQEALEGVRAVRDSNALYTSLSDTPKDLMEGIPVGEDFTVDMSKFVDGKPVLNDCNGACGPLTTSDDPDPSRASFYGYGYAKNTAFTRTVSVCFVQSNGTCATTPVTDEVKVLSRVSWITGSYQRRDFVMSAYFYRWLSSTAVAGGGASISAAATYAPGSAINIVVSDPNTIPNDFVTLENATMPVCTDPSMQLKYLDNSTSPPGVLFTDPVNITFSAPWNPGSYVFTLYGNGGSCDSGSILTQWAFEVL